jgi:hypothetical protein
VGVSRTASDRTAQKHKPGSRWFCGAWKTSREAFGGTLKRIGIDRSISEAEQQEHGTQTTSHGRRSRSGNDHSANGAALTFAKRASPRTVAITVTMRSVRRGIRWRKVQRAQSLEKQAARSEEQAIPSTYVVSDAQHRGWQLTDDMSQVIASRYNALTSSRYAGLGAPSLNQVDLTARQRESAIPSWPIFCRNIVEWRDGGAAEGSEMGALLHRRSHLPRRPCAIRCGEAGRADEAASKKLVDRRKSVGQRKALSEGNTRLSERASARHSGPPADQCA